jgi:hypothetical protein
VNDRAAAPASVADTLREALARAETGTFTFADLVAAGGERAFVLLLILMNLPNVIFAPPVIAGVVAVPTLAFGVQLMLGRGGPTLPPWVLRQPVAVMPLRKVLDLTGPALRRAEGLGRPRLPLMSRHAPRLLGLFAAIAGLIILLPIPGTNVLPALSVVALGIGALRRDGILTLLGVGLGCLGVAVTILAAGLLIELVRWGLSAV